MTEKQLDQTDPPVTIAITRRVKPGREAEFEAFLNGITAAASRFPGHLGTNIFRPSSPDDRTYRVIFKFDHASNLRRWEGSDERKMWLAYGEELMDGPPQQQVLTGLETWFTLPGVPAMVPPPRYKMAVVSWLAIYPLSLLVFTLLGEVLNTLPLLLRTLLFTLIMISMMTYLVMPQMTRLFKWWLYPSDHPQVKTHERPSGP